VTCERIREQFPACLAGRLDPAAREKVIDHLETCSACRAEMAELGVVWRGMEAMQEPEPSPAMRSRFLETLHAYQEGYQEAQRRPTSPVRTNFWSGWWPARPAWQAAFAALLLAAGVLGGRYALSPRAPAANPELAQLQGQVENLRQLVALSLLQQQSPSARLRGVTYSYQISQPDQQVQQALLHAVNHDSNVNVRLSAVDALAKFGRDPAVRRALADSLATQDSPLVQVALIDLLAQLGEKDTVGALRQLARDGRTDQEVRQRAASAAEKLGATQ
jgi:Putative zinc-finger/HEAT repeats